MARDLRADLKLTTAPTVLPLTLAEVKSHLDISDADEADDPGLMAMLRAATISAERFTRRSFLPTTWTLWMDRFPGKALPWWDGVRQMADTELTDLTESIEVPRPPLVSVTHVKAHKQDGSTTTVTATDYIVDAESEPGRIALKMSKSWPTDALRSIHGVEVEFVAGYPSAAAVPDPIRAALLVIVADLHTNRDGEAFRSEKVGESSVTRFAPEEVPMPARRLLDSYKIWRL